MYCLFSDVCFIVFFFFFKHKTAYEMRISDWSSDVCSDLQFRCAMHHNRSGAADRLWCIAQRNWFLRLLPMNDTRLKLMEAIARRRMISASYNGNRMTLAPHLMFERRGDLFVSALNLGKNWRSEEEIGRAHV